MPSLTVLISVVVLILLLTVLAALPWRKPRCKNKNYKKQAKKCPSYGDTMLDVSPNSRPRTAFICLTCREFSSSQ